LLENKRKFVVTMDVVKEKKIDILSGIDDDLSRKVTKGGI
jgi:hypothetical protein